MYNFKYVHYTFTRKQQYYKPERVNICMSLKIYMKLYNGLPLQEKWFN